MNWKRFYSICGCVALVGAVLAGAALLGGANTNVQVNGGGVQILYPYDASGVVSTAVSGSGERVAVPGGEYEEHRVSEHDLPAFTSVNIQVHDAAVTLEEGDSFGVELFYTTAPGKTNSLEYELRDGVLKVTQKSRSNGVNFNLTVGGYQGYYIPTDTVTVTYPADTKFQDVNIRCSYEDVSLGAVCADTVKVDTSNGTTTLREVWAPVVDVKNDYGSIDYKNSAEQAVGELILRSSNSKMELTGVYPDTADIVNSYGSLSYTGERTHPLTSIQLEADNCEMRLEDLFAGEARIVNRYGSVTLNSGSGHTMRSLVLEAENCDMTLREIESTALEITNKYGSVELLDVTAATALMRMDNADVRADGFTADSVDMDNNYGSLRATGWSSGAFRARMDNGSLEIAGSLRGENTITNTYGTTRLQPTEAKSAYSYALSTTYGSIRLGDERLEGTYTKDNAGADHSISITASNGDIELIFTE